jgi:hypothetical protein
MTDPVTNVLISLLTYDSTYKLESIFWVSMSYMFMFSCVIACLVLLYIIYELALVIVVSYIYVHMHSSIQKTLLNIIDDESF